TQPASLLDGRLSPGEERAHAVAGQVSPMTQTTASPQGIGARVARKEDDRLLRGRGQFVADIRLPEIKDIAFVRSPVAHGRIRSIPTPPDQRGNTFTAADLVGVKPIRAISGLRGLKISEAPPLAHAKSAHG